jgi:catechol 2,3-dioxygenase-like lactoylglutathione lyase family enzyme
MLCGEMFDHVTIRVRDRSASERFYETVLAPLGIETTYSTKSFSEWHDFGLTEADGDHDVTRGLHVAFSAPSRAQVDDFWQAGVDAGHVGDGPPGLRPQYREDYYGAFVRDPSGNSIEAVHHDARRRDGAIDHIWIRVSDLMPATAFYEIVAKAADFEVQYTGPDRTSFAGVSRGSFSLVEGMPTENLHMAFPADDEAVRRFYADATAAGHRGNGQPGERPQYHRGYYAAYVLDPDGNNIEVVNHHRA